MSTNQSSKLRAAPLLLVPAMAPIGIPIAGPMGTDHIVLTSGSL